MDDPHGLARFVVAQDAVIDAALDELRRGRKRGHWMWFVFPQLAGLGRSPTAQAYAIADAEEALAYLAHPVLSRRLHAAADALLAAPGDDPAAILGSVDAMKLRSSATLFAAVGDDARSAELLDRFFAGRPDPVTLRLLRDGRIERGAAGVAGPE